MSYPITTLWSPKKDYILLYEVSEDKHLTISRCPTGSTDIKRYKKDRFMPDGQLKQPTTLSAVYFRGVPTVFGSVEVVPDQSKKEIKKTVVSQISPNIETVIQKSQIDNITLSEENSAVAAVSDNKNSVWLYYFQRESGSGAKALSLSCLEIVGDSLPQPLVCDGVPAMESSRMAVVALPEADKTAETDGPDRLLVYQAKQDKNSLRYFHHYGTVTTEGVIAGTGTAVANTPLALVCTGSGDSREITLYWINTASEVVKSVNTGTKLKNWAAAKKVDTANRTNYPLSSETELSVVAGENNQKYLFLIAPEKGSTEKLYNYVLDS